MNHNKLCFTVNYFTYFIILLINTNKIFYLTLHKFKCISKFDITPFSFPAN